jgi:hypothetical protein
MSRFRLFGRPPGSAPPEPPAGPERTGGSRWPTAAPTTGAQPAVAGAEPDRPFAGAGPTWADGPATRAARPAAGRYGGDPPTNPFGYPPVAGPPAGARSGSLPGTAGPAPYPDRAEASALAGAFAVDYLSWDETDPARRGRALAEYLPPAASDPARLGWAGRGRQRAEFVLAGRIRPDGEGRVLVDVRVRVTPYRPVGDDPARSGPAPADERSTAVGSPAAAPAPTAPGWRSLASQWVRLTVPVVLDGDRLLVDAWEEMVAAVQPAPRGPAAGAPRREDHLLADDDPAADFDLDPLSGPMTTVTGRSSTPARAPARTAGASSNSAATRSGAASRTATGPAAHPPTGSASRTDAASPGADPATRSSTRTGTGARNTGAHPVTGTAAAAAYPGTDPATSSSTRTGTGATTRAGTTGGHPTGTAAARARAGAATRAMDDVLSEPVIGGTTLAAGGAPAEPFGGRPR